MRSRLAQLMLLVSSALLVAAIAAPGASAQTRTTFLSKSSWAMLNPQPLPPEPPPEAIRKQVIKPNAGMTSIIIVGGKTASPLAVKPATAR